MDSSVRATAEAFFERLDANDLDGAMNFLADTCAVWIATMPGDAAGPEHTGTTVPKAAFVDMMAKSQELAPAGMRFTIHSCIAEGDQVAVEVESRADLADGRLYNNRYSFWFRVDQGSITELREYFDSKYASDFFLSLLQKP